MCELCELKSKPLDTAYFRKNLTEMYQGISASMSSRQGDGALRQFFVKLLRDTADQIEMNTVAERSFRIDLREIDNTVKEKSRKVDVGLLKEEGAFYQQYGTVMPHSVRASIRTRIWDSLEQEISDVGTQREPSGNDEGNGDSGAATNSYTEGSD